MQVVDRKDWAAINIAGLREVVTPLVGRLSGDKQPGVLTDAIGSRLTGVQAGTVLAYLSGRVLGQYEVFSSDPGQLLLVAPQPAGDTRERAEGARVRETGGEGAPAGQRARRGEPNGPCALRRPWGGPCSRCRHR